MSSMLALEGSLARRVTPLVTLSKSPDARGISILIKGSIGLNNEKNCRRPRRIKKPRTIDNILEILMISLSGDFKRTKNISSGFR
jgi:hypothetical protein